MFFIKEEIKKDVISMYIYVYTTAFVYFFDW